MKNKQKGLTLVELMVTLAVAITMMALGVPLYQGLVSSNRAAAQSNALVSGINLARSEAVKRSQTVIVCPDADTTPTTLVCGDKDDWANGWITFADADGDGALDSGEEIRVHGELSGSSVVTTTADLFQFNSDGSSAAAVSLKAEQNKCSGSQARRINIGLSGQVRVEKESCT